MRFLDDFLLLFASVCLIAATILLNLGADSLYQVGAVNATELAAMIPLKVISAAITKIQNYTYPFGALIWACIFLVKFCYLAFFRLLIDRQKALVNYWRVTMVVVFLSACFDISSSFIGCSHFGSENLLCSNHYYTQRILAVEAVTITLDIVTDLMILAIPPYLMYKVQIKQRQKLGIGFFLCLSVFMIIIAIIRISRVHATDFEIWASFWQQFEGCIAVLMVSLTAFRTLFVSKASKSENSPQKFKVSDTYKRRIWFSKRSDGSSQSGEKGHVDVAVPGATLTGMRTFIGGDGFMDSMTTNGDLGGHVVHTTPDLEANSDTVRHSSS